MVPDNDILLEVKGLKKYFPITKGFLKRTVGYVKAVDGVDFYIREGETLGLVGESGCGKTTTGKVILRAVSPTAGEMFLRHNGEVVDVAGVEEKELKILRRDMQVIFQDPYSSLNPRMTILDIVGEPLLVHKMAKGRELEDRVKELLRVVGLNVQYLKRYPHALSGGQRQRVGIARALALHPKLIIADEAVSALDVSVQAQVLNLLKDLQEEFHLTYLFIAHDLGVVEHISDRVAVMYVGKIVEMAETEKLFLSPKHPYTEALMSSAPKADPRLKSERIILSGEVASPVNPPPGCSFHPRCRYMQDVCKTEEPPLEEMEEGHYARCHFGKELKLKGAI